MLLYEELARRMRYACVRDDDHAAAARAGRMHVLLNKECEHVLVVVWCLKSVLVVLWCLKYMVVQSLASTCAVSLPELA